MWTDETLFGEKLWRVKAKVSVDGELHACAMQASRNTIQLSLTCGACRHEMEFRMASELEMQWGCNVTQWKSKKIERQKKKGEK